MEQDLASADSEVMERLGLGRSHTRRRVLRWTIAVLVLAAIVIAVFYWVRSAANPELAHRTTEARIGDLVVTVTATGTLQPRNQVDVGSEISGRLAEVLVDYNQPVTIGQALAMLDTEQLDAQVMRSEASLESARATVREAEATLAEMRANASRMETLAQRNIASPQELDAARAAAARAEASVAIARAQVSLAEASLEADMATQAKAVIRSPINGLVISRNIEPGQTVVASLQAPVLFTLAEDLRQMELHLDVDEADIGQIEADQSARFSVDAYPNRRFDAELSQVRYAPRTVQGVVTYEALLSVDNPELLLRPGMTATAEIATEHRREVLLIPNGALRFAPVDAEAVAAAPVPDQPDQRVAWTLESTTPAPVLITIGITDGQWTEVTAGPIAAGTPLVIDVVRPGT
ncbi:MAG: efflux RND transporter periplasmic adaptor subunit [Alphaproteobacteria bacterium]